MFDPLKTFDTISTRCGDVYICRPDHLPIDLGPGMDHLPYVVRVLLENALRHMDGQSVTEDDVRAIASWPDLAGKKEIPFSPARVLLQDFTGVPAIVDLAALRSSVARLGFDPTLINPVIPVDLVIDHSVQVDVAGSPGALVANMQYEMQRNHERYTFLRWGMEVFDNFRVVPPAMGIVHQVNMEYLASVVMTADIDGKRVAFPDSVVGTDSHTTMINGLGVLGWGVGGIEAEHAMIGQPLSILLPEVVGVRFTGVLRPGVTATDLVLTVTERLRAMNVVGKFVEFFGEGLGSLSLADRTTIANMAPEYGATTGFFPISATTLAYLELTGRDGDHLDLIERVAKAQGLFWSPGDPEPSYSDVVEIDLSVIEASLAGPRRPQDRVPLAEASRAFAAYLADLPADKKAASPVAIDIDGQNAVLDNGAVVIAAITSCTNTSNPAVMIGAGLMAKAAIEKGLTVAPHVKTSFAPGSRVVTRYLDKAGLTPYLDALGFQTVGYGCTTCIGNSGPLQNEIEQVIRDNDLVAVAVLSGNRNFEGRVHPLTRANYLASPPLVLAYALAGRMDLDIYSEPLGFDRLGRPVLLSDIWPSPAEVANVIAGSLSTSDFIDEYARIFTASEMWNTIPVTGGVLYDWDPDSTYIQEPPFFTEFSEHEPGIEAIIGARVLALLGDSVTTDHISPAGTIPYNSPAADYLRSRGVASADFNSFGSRRGNHEVMMRGTFGNIRLRNRLVPGIEGGLTRYLSSGEGGDVMTIYDAAMRYRSEGIPLIVIAGREYGTGSSRDWAAKGVHLLGVKAVLAESFERIHRSNLVGMGVLPLQFLPGQNAESLALTGEEVFSMPALVGELAPGARITVEVVNGKGVVRVITAIARIDSQVELKYLVNGGILHTALREMIHR